MQNSPAHTPPAPAWFGAIFVAVGAGMMIAMAVDRSGLQAPLWVAELAAFCFVLAGASVLANGRGWTRLARALGVGVVYCMAAIPVWIVFGDSSAGCTVSGTGLFAGEIGSWVGCRAAFAVSAVLTILCAIALTWAALTGRSSFQGKRP